MLWRKPQKRPVLRGVAKLEGVNSDAQRVYAELSERLERLRAQGMVDCKVTCNPTRHSTTFSMMWTLNNVLRLHEEGRFERVDVH